MKHKTQEKLIALGISDEQSGTFCGEWLKSGAAEPRYSVIDGTPLGSVCGTSPEEYEKVISAAESAFLSFRNCPAPLRGEIIREIAVEVRKHKAELGELISLEAGKILPEALGEVQEVIDIADFAVGLSRQLYGLSMHSERPRHRMYEQWHPLGPVGVITAFNFPMAVWAWNACIAAVCGNSVVWKPSELTPFSAIALIKICANVAARHGFPAVFSMINGGAPLGVKLADDMRLPLISATGSTRMGRDVSARVAKRLGRSLLELGGNNAVVVLKDANMQLASRAVVFGAVGTAGQRCTSIRRLLVETPVLEPLLERLKSAYSNLPIGNPLQAGTLVGPLIHKTAVEQHFAAIERAKAEGGKVVYGGEKLSGMPGENYVQPVIILAPKTLDIMRDETFAPILYVQEISGVKDGILKNNEVRQGLSSAIFTESIRLAEEFLSSGGSDCGIANVNIGTSGAEIGGAFGGEKDTGGGREAGSDSWKAYMRRQTTTINWSDELPLAQGVKFE